MLTYKILYFRNIVPYLNLNTKCMLNSHRKKKAQGVLSGLR